MIARKGLFYVVLSQLCRSIDRHASIPALHHVRLEADGATLRIDATDLTTHIVATIPCQGRITTCLPARALMDFTKPENAADGQGVVELLPEDSGRVSVAVEAALTTMQALPASEFPRRPADKYAASEWRRAGGWCAPDFAAAIGWVALAVGTDETRRHLAGVLFAPDEIVALDGHRLHLARVPGLGTSPTLLPGQSIRALLRVLPKSGELGAFRAKNSIRFRCATGNAQWEVETQVMEETFPPFNQVIPSADGETFRADVERAALMRSLARVGRSKDRRHTGVRLVINGAIRIERDGDDGGTASSTLPVLHTTHEGPDTIIGVNGAFLADALACDVPIVIARFGGELDPVRLDLGPDKLAVVMPMRM